MNFIHHQESGAPNSFVPSSKGPRMDEIKQTSDMKYSKSKKSLSAKLLPGDWICNSCQLNNFASRVKCISCGSSHAGAIRPIDRIGDWTCPHDSCRFHNFANRRECHKCGTRKPIKSVSSLKVGDWICSKPTCLAHNFAKRDVCFQCGTIPISIQNTSKNSVNGLKSFFVDYGESLFSSQNPFSPN